MARRSRPQQPSLFAEEVLDLAAEPRSEDAELARRLPSDLRLGTMSWSFPGWRGIVYSRGSDGKRLASDGLPAYARHPLLGAVEIDRSYYEPLGVSVYAQYAAQVPATFRFVVKAHEECSVRRFPGHSRYGRKRGESNARYLDPAYAVDAVIGPAAEGLGETLGAIVFQFPPQDAGGPEAFADELAEFLDALPRSVTCAVEIRNRELLTPRYAAALAQGGAVHCHNVWGEMPSVVQQAKLIPPMARRPLIVRWLMRRGADYEDSRSAYAPFDRIVEPDLENRAAIAHLVGRAVQHDVPAFVLVNNKAEGCAPESLLELARALVMAER